MSSANTLSCHLYKNDPVKRIKNYLHAAQLTNKPNVHYSELLPYDQMHYQGTEALDQAARQISLKPGNSILDIGPGFGGPARYLAQTYQCKVTGIEIQKNIGEFAIELNKLVKTDNDVEIIIDDFLNHSFETKFDHVIAFLSFLHIQDKDLLWSKCYSLLNPHGNFYIEDYYVNKTLNPTEEQILKNVVGVARPSSRDDQISKLKEFGFKNIIFSDLTKDWANWTAQRAIDYKNNLYHHIEIQGDKNAVQLLEFYEVVANMFNTKKIRGMSLYGKK